MHVDEQLNSFGQFPNRMGGFQFTLYYVVSQECSLLTVARFSHYVLLVQFGHEIKGCSCLSIFFLDCGHPFLLYKRSFWRAGSAFVVFWTSIVKAGESPTSGSQSHLALLVIKEFIRPNWECSIHTLPCCLVGLYVDKSMAYLWSLLAAIAEMPFLRLNMATVVCGQRREILSPYKCW